MSSSPSRRRTRPRTPWEPWSAGPEAWPAGINDAGYLTGYGTTGTGDQHPFLSTFQGPLVDLGLPPDAKRAFGMAINNSRVVAGHSVSETGLTNAFLYNPSSSSFTVLPLPAGATGSAATTINDAQEVAGYLFTSGQMHAAVALDGTWTDLGDVLGGGAARLNDLNHLRQGVGTARDASGQWRAFYYENGKTYDLNQLLPLDSGWTLTDARAINDQGQVVGVGQKDGQTRAFLLFPATEIGRRVYRPEGTLPTMPQVDLIQADPGNNSINSFLWSEVDQKFFAVRPAAAIVRWHTGRYTLATNETQFGDSVIRQVMTNEILIPALSFNVWPRDPNIQVASAPAELEPPFQGFNYSFIEIAYSTINGAAVDPGPKVFNTPFGSGGYTVFRYLVSNGQPPNAQQQGIRFNVTRTVAWNDPAYLTNATATVGLILTNALHDDYPGRNGWLVFTNAYYDGALPDPAYVRTNRSGNILPVNAVTNRDDFVVAWYGRDRLGVAWPELPAKYQILWPTNAPHLVIASGQGTGPIPPDQYPNARIYNQPDANQPGFNPNEEHAMFAPGAVGTGTAVFALRNDLNGSRGGIPKDSEPFVLLKYQDPANQLWRIQAFQVLAEEPPYRLVYAGTAGNQIQAPYPLSLLPQLPQTYAVSGPWWQDVAGRFYALAGGEPFGESTVVMRYFYPLQAGFWYDLNNDGTNDVPVGTAIPWLSLLSPDQPQGQPADIPYQIHWPTGIPALAIGETLYGATHGLPDVQDMASVQVVYDSSVTTAPPDGYANLNQLARLFDPLSPRTVPITGSTSWLSAFNLADDITSGTKVFADLPYYLRVRFYYDPTVPGLSFKGFIQPQSVGADLTLVNVMSQNERNRIQALDGTNGVTPFDSLIQQLYVLTRNPNQLDLQPRDGTPDDALYIGLTYDRTGTNAVPEQLGSGPKALTAGLPRVSQDSREGTWLNFDGGTLVHLDGYSHTNEPYADVTNNFTIEFWAKPTAGRVSSQESNGGIQNDALLGGRFVLFPPQGTDAYGIGNITAGVSLGTNGISVFEHAAAYLPTVLVYDAPILDWTHVALVFTNGVASLYLNGFLVHVGQPVAGGNLVHPGNNLGGDIERTEFGRYMGDLT
ncbi:MAG: hypothetical protein KIT22_03320, partial [Verrucomicrobiae bacterium]|nr:hypothetical protein [Verrucomicrobiae bacterium]